ncbi:hypothetical protein GS896_27500 [Rhodococcus hoagii]|nr:hypothetical protein [Prescottella equi]MBM4570256.1 hypothetical protein [Prescottella equi]MBM4574806.1 hypothetical protein [Prescottella equi]MBM4575112.1 hypothetical protein [Prescottella equi]MBM4653998.1 hypothetical protein [Prescottella equi]
MRLKLEVARRLDATSEIVAGHLTTYARFATIVPGEPDWPFLIRVLRECRLAADRLTDTADIDAFHLEPLSTGHRGWDAILAGVAEITGADRVSDPQIIQWCREPHRYSPTLFDPLATGKYVWLEYMRTPIQLRERNIVLAAGNLEGV